MIAMSVRRSCLWLVIPAISLVITGCGSETAGVSDVLSTVDSLVSATSEPTTTTVAKGATTVPKGEVTGSVDTTLTSVGTSVIPNVDTSVVESAPEESDPRSFDALVVLDSLTVENEVNEGYDRDLFRHWIDDDGNGCDTRQEVLKRDSLTLPQIDPYRCKVIAGDWYSPYDGATWTDPSDVDIDHVVALKEAWGSGAWNWSSEKRRAFANDLSDSRSLMAVTDSVNQSKSDSDPSQWMPPRRDYRCTYLSIWLAIKARWSLSVDSSEEGAIRAQLRETCRGLRVAKWTPAPIT